MLLSLLVAVAVPLRLRARSRWQKEVADERRAGPAARAAGRRPAGARRPHARLRLRLRPAGRRPVGREAVAAYAGSNGLDPTAVPAACCAMENELVGFACDLLDAPDAAVGSVTSGGTESVLLAVQAARDAAPEVSEPDDGACPSTVHAAFHKAAHYFGVTARGRAGRPRLPRRRRRDGRGASTSATVLVVGSAPSYAHGVVDPIPAARRRSPRRAGSAATSTRASAAGCCRTPRGWGGRCRRGRSPSTGSPRSRSTPTSTPTRPRARRCCCTGRPTLRRPQFFASADWPGYTMLNSTMQSTKSGGPLAGAWAVVQHLGDVGLPARWRRQVFEAVDRIVAGRVLAGLSVVVPPDSTLVALACDASCDAFTVVRRDEGARLVRAAADVVRRRGRRRSTSRSRPRPCRHVDELLADLASSVAAARAAGPVSVDPGSSRSSGRSTRPPSPTRTSTACWPPPA